MEKLENTFLDFASYSEARARELDPLALAFIGDAIHTFYVRKSVLIMHNASAGTLHALSLKFCKASAQAKCLDEIVSSLSEEEISITKRARNHKSSHIPKNSDLEIYKKASAFEALIGYLYVIGNKDKLEEILLKSINIGD